MPNSAATTRLTATQLDTSEASCCLNVELASANDATELVVYPTVAQGRQLRDIFGAFATGVTVVSIFTPDGEPQGMTVNSFSSVSLDPALVLWSVANDSGRVNSYKGAARFAVNVLSAQQSAMATSFASDPAAFDRYHWFTGEFDSPVLSGCVASFECRQHAAHDGGDHTIIVGEVLRATLHPKEPLVFSKGQFGTFARP